MINNIDERVNSILEYLIDIIELDHGRILSIKTAVSLVHEVTPTDISLIFTKMDNIIAASEDLAWTIQVLRKLKSRLSRTIKNTKDPEFTMLTRKGRPSTTAIESEIRFNHPELLDMEESYDIVSGIIDYLQHIELCLDRRIWSIKDRISMSKM